MKTNPKIEALKHVFRQVSELGHQIYADSRRLAPHLDESKVTMRDGKPYLHLDSMDDYHQLRSDLASVIEDELIELEDKKGWHLCTNNCDDPPCFNLCDPECEDAYWPTDEMREELLRRRKAGEKVYGLTQYEYCPECIEAYRAGLTYSDRVAQREKAARDEKERARIAQRNAAIRAVDPKRADYYAEQERKRKQRLAELRAASSGD